MKLKVYLPSEEVITIAVKPENLTRFPEEYDNRFDYQQHRDELLGSSSGGDSCKPSPAVLERLHGVQADGDMCAICQETIDGSYIADIPSGDQFPVFQGRGTKLPCNHSFHLDCILRWITPEKAECPCCRRVIL